MPHSNRPCSRKAIPPLPRYWKRTIRELTGLKFCDRDCSCGQNNQLWWFTFGITERKSLGIPEWVPDWMNGGDTNEIWRWLCENGKA